MIRLRIIAWLCVLALGLQPLHVIDGESNFTVPPASVGSAVGQAARAHVRSLTGFAHRLFETLADSLHSVVRHAVELLEECELFGGGRKKKTTVNADLKVLKQNATLIKKATKNLKSKSTKAGAIQRDARNLERKANDLTPRSSAVAVKEVVKTAEEIERKVKTLKTGSVNVYELDKAVGEFGNTGNKIAAKMGAGGTGTGSTEVSTGDTISAKGVKELNDNVADMKGTINEIRNNMDPDSHSGKDVREFLRKVLPGKLESMRKDLKQVKGIAGIGSGGSSDQAVHNVVQLEKNKALIGAAVKENKDGGLDDEKTLNVIKTNLEDTLANLELGAKVIDTSGLGSIVLGLDQGIGAQVDKVAEDLDRLYGKITKGILDNIEPQVEPKRDVDKEKVLDDLFKNVDVIETNLDPSKVPIGDVQEFINMELAAHLANVNMEIVLLEPPKDLGKLKEDAERSLGALGENPTEKDVDAVSVKIENFLQPMLASQKIDQARFMTIIQLLIKLRLSPRLRKPGSSSVDVRSVQIDLLEALATLPGTKAEVGPDLYKLLGVDRRASENEIKKAYYKLAMKYHPDKGGDEDMFQAINEAYKVLSNPKRRAEYDEYGKDDAFIGDEDLDMNAEDYVARMARGFFDKDEADDRAVPKLRRKSEGGGDQYSHRKEQLRRKADDRAVPDLRRKSANGGDRYLHPRQEQLRKEERIRQEERSKKLKTDKRLNEDDILEVFKDLEDEDLYEGNTLTQDTARSKKNS